MTVVVTKTFRFEASHILPRHPGKCSRLHGHSWVLHVSVEGPVDSDTGFVVDYAALSVCVQEHIVSKLDHTHLGQGSMLQCPGSVKPPGEYYNDPYFGGNFYPSSENLVLAFVHILRPLVKELAPHVRLYQVRLDETCTSAATWTARDTGNEDGF